MTLRVFMIAGEASGDALGAALIDGLRQLAPQTQFEGIAGTQMQARGVQSLFPMDELSVMGLAEIAPKYFHLKRRIAQTAKAVVDAAPDVLVTIDSPDFCLRVARLVRAGRPSQRVVHYVAPSVWAWRPGRAAKMAPLVDQVLALLPFEPPYMEAAGIACDFVGHPVVAAPQATAVDAHAFRDGLGLGTAPLIVALPGSRKGEVTRLAPRIGAALERVACQFDGTQVVLPAAHGVAPMVAEMAASWNLPVRVLDPEDQAGKRAAFRAADVALAASGTVSLELAAASTPMVICYDMAWLTLQIIRRMMRVDTFTLVNLVSETRAVPEFVGKACTPDALAKALGATLDDPAPQIAAATETMRRLGRDDEDPGLRAARAVLARM